MRIGELAALRPRDGGSLGAHVATTTGSPYTRSTAQRGRVAMAHPAAASHRQRLCLMRAPTSARRSGGHAAFEPGMPGSSPSRDSSRSRRGAGSRMWDQKRHCARSGERVPGAAGIDEHPPGSERNCQESHHEVAVGRKPRHRASSDNCSTMPMARVTRGSLGDGAPLTIGY